MKVLFNPTDSKSFVRVQATLTGNMLGAFKELRHDVKNESPWNTIQSSLADAIIFARLEGYRQASIAVGCVPINTDYIRLRHDGLSRAEWVANQMQDWTKQSLMASKKSKLLSKERASKSATYESRKAFFEGALRGFKLNKKARKEWLTSDAHDQDDICDDNEDDGIIDMDEPFSSGDMIPPAHLYCECSLFCHV